MFVESLHESDGEDIVGSPEAGNDGFSASEEEGAFKAGDAFRAQQLSGTGFAGGKHNQVGSKRQIANLTDLKETVVWRGRRCAEDKSRSVRELSIGHTMN